MDGYDMTLSPTAMKAVGLDFNPSGDPKVIQVKQLFAEIITIMERVRDDAPDGSSSAMSASRHAAIAITDAETAQMRAVKAITWK